MGAPLFKVQIVYPDGSTIMFNGGGAFERNMVHTIAEDAVVRVLEKLPTAVQQRGVGIWRTETHVLRDVEDAIREVLPTLLEESVSSVLLKLKEETRRLV